MNSVFLEAGALGIGSSFGTMAETIKSGIGEVAPYALGVLGLFLAWKYGAKFFRSLSK